MACVGGMPEIAHRGGLLPSPILAQATDDGFAFVGAHPVGDGMVRRDARNRPQGWAPTIEMLKQMSAYERT